MAVSDGAPPPTLDALIAESAGPPPPPKFPRWGWWAIGVTIFLSIVVIAGFVIHVPYSTISPGEAVSLPPLVHVDGSAARPNDRGDIRLLFVRERNHVNLWRYLQAKLDKDVDLYKESVITGGLSPGDLNADAEADMADAKVSATKVALEAAGYKVPDPRGLLVEAAFPGRPAAKVLQPGDIIVSADGTNVVHGKELTDAIAKHTAGSKVKLGIIRNGKAMTVEVPIAIEQCTPADGPDCKPRPAIGVRVFPHYQFPVEVNVDTAGIGGPSAGLAMTLAILDDLTPGNLTGGKRVAVTGTIDPSGNVGEIGGINQKAVAARAAGAKLFIVPQCAKDDPPAQLTSCQHDLKRAIERAGSGVKVVPVSTFDQALQALRDNGGGVIEKTAPTSPATSQAA